MASASHPVSGDQQGLFKITVGQLAGGTGLKGLEKYKAKVKIAEDQRNNGLEKDSRECTCTSIALGVLFLIAAAGAATLIAFSGGPNNVQLFYTGIAIGVVALGVLGGLIYKIIDAVKYAKDQEKVFAEATNDEVQEKVLLPELEAVDVETVEEVMKQLDQPGQRKEFIGYIHENYFPEEEEVQEGENGGKKAEKKAAPPKPLTEEQKKVLSVVAQFPDDLSVEFVGQATREFALEILRNIDAKAVDSHTALIYALFDKVGSPQTVGDEVQIFARHPKAVAQLVQDGDEDFALTVVPAIFTEMGYRQQASFLKSMHQAVYAEKDVDKLPVLNRCVGLCIYMAVKEEFIDIVSKGEPVDENEKKEFKRADALLTQIARWPDQAARRVYLTKKSLLSVPGFINALYAKISDGDKATFVNVASSQLSDAFDCAAWINEYAVKNVVLSRPTMLIFARKPIAMARAMGSLASPRAQQYASEIQVLMSADHLLTFFETEKNHSEGTYKSRMQAMLMGIKTQPAAAKPDNLAIRYLKQHAGEFKSWILDNKQLDANEEARRVVALNILEQMDEKAEEVISSLDSYTLGYSYFNSLTNSLLNQVKAIDLAANPNAVSDSRKRLIARFMYAPQMANARTSNFGTTLTPNGPVWNNFNTLAGPSAAATGVWQPRQN